MVGCFSIYIDMIYHQRRDCVYQEIFTILLLGSFMHRGYLLMQKNITSIIIAAIAAECKKVWSSARPSRLSFQKPRLKACILCNKRSWPWPWPWQTQVTINFFAHNIRKKSETWFFKIYFDESLTCRWNVSIKGIQNNIKYNSIYLCNNFKFKHLWNCHISVLITKIWDVATRKGITGISG